MVATVSEDLACCWTLGTLWKVGVWVWVGVGVGGCGCGVWWWGGEAKLCKVGKFIVD